MSAAIQYDVRQSMTRMVFPPVRYIQVKARIKGLEAHML